MQAWELVKCITPTAHFWTMASKKPHPLRRSTDRPEGNNSQSVRELVFSAHILNFIDAVLTLHFLTAGVEEANPFLASLYEISPAFFLIAKFLLVVFGVEVLHRHVKGKKRVALLGGVCLLFTCVIVWQLAGVISIYVIH